jgi:hypothetical protein
MAPPALRVARPPIAAPVAPPSNIPFTGGASRADPAQPASIRLAASTVAVFNMDPSKRSVALRASHPCKNDRSKERQVERTMQERRTADIRIYGR